MVGPDAVEQPADAFGDLRQEHRGLGGAAHAVRTRSSARQRSPLIQ
jgi:hypothetical protein